MLKLTDNRFRIFYDAIIFYNFKMEKKNPNDWTNRSIIFTASNKGIGFASLVNILRKGKYSKVIMTSRSEDKAKKALLNLEKIVGKEKAS